MDEDEFSSQVVEGVEQCFVESNPHDLWVILEIIFDTLECAWGSAA